MRRALELARKGWGQTAPNPMVGAVVVAAGEVVGEGYHARYGEVHAEVVALRAARASRTPLYPNRKLMRGNFKHGRGYCRQMFWYSTKYS